MSKITLHCNCGQPVTVDVSYLYPFKDCGPAWVICKECDDKTKNEGPVLSDRERWLLEHDEEVKP